MRIKSSSTNKQKQMKHRLQHYSQNSCPLECLFLACAVLPTPRQKRLKGIACLWAKTSSKYLLALVKGNFLIANAISMVFCNEKLKDNLKSLKTHGENKTAEQIYLKLSKTNNCILQACIG